MSERTKSPLHPSALPLNGMNVGRRIVGFNTQTGINLEGMIIKAPYVAHLIYPHLTAKAFKVDVRTKSGHIEPFYLTDLGVIPMVGPNSNVKHFQWNPMNFVVDERRRELVLASLVERTRHTDSYYEFEDEIYYEFDFEYGYTDL